MGKRSRKRDVHVAPAEPVVAPSPGRAPDPERSRRARLDELPKPPWAPFPLVEVCVLLGLILMGIGLFAGGDRAPVLLLCGVGLASLAGLEQATREHFAGFRSHTTLLAGFCTIVTLIATIALGLGRAIAPVAAVAVGGAVWLLLRRSFTRRSGGFGFRA